jgi:hypothetical protein
MSSWLIGYSVTFFKRSCDLDKFVNFHNCFHEWGGEVES